MHFRSSTSFYDHNDKNKEFFINIHSKENAHNKEKDYKIKIK